MSKNLIASIGESPLGRCGLVPASDLQTVEWREIFTLLEQQQAGFLAKEAHFRSPEYKWPRDPLHWWSRVWEYPYAYFNLSRMPQPIASTARPVVMDLGSGVTFFPFSLAMLGLDVVCADIDPICEQDIRRAAQLFPCPSGSVDFRLILDSRLPFADGEVDAIYCISVIEHIPEIQFPQIFAEMARVLKAGGTLILTMDVDLRGDSQLSASSFSSLQTAFSKHFAKAKPETTVHPADLLTSCNSPFPLKHASWFRRIKQAIGSFLTERMLSSSSTAPLHLALYAAVAVKK